MHAIITNYKVTVVELLLTQGAKVNFQYKLVSKFNLSILDWQLIDTSSFTTAASK